MHRLVRVISDPTVAYFKCTVCMPMFSAIQLSDLQSFDPPDRVWSGGRVSLPLTVSVCSAQSVGLPRLNHLEAYHYHTPPLTQRAMPNPQIHDSYTGLAPANNTGCGRNLHLPRPPPHYTHPPAQAKRQGNGAKLSRLWLTVRAGQPTSSLIRLVRGFDYIQSLRVQSLSYCVYILFIK